jgi:hypothetical protein
VDLVASKETAVVISGRLLVKYIESPNNRKYIVTGMSGDCSLLVMALCAGAGPYECDGVLALRLPIFSGCSLNSFCSSFGWVSKTVPSSLCSMWIPRNESVRYVG